MKIDVRAKNKGKNYKANKRMRIIIVLLMLISIFLNTGSPVYAASFADVPSSHWAYKAIDYVSTNGYMNGIGNNLFNPDGVSTKGHVITALYRVSQDGTPTNSQPYTDVSSGHFYYDAVRWAYNNSLSSVIHTTSTIFSPDSALYRVKMAELIWQFAQVKGWANNTVPSISLPYTDITNLPTSQKNALKWCYYNSIMTGTSGTTFSPYTTITRAQLAKLIYNFDRYVAQNRAFCVGTKYNDSQNLDTSGDATTAKSYFEGMGYTVECSTTPTVDIMRKHHNIKKNILFFSGHGSHTCMQFHHMQQEYPYKTGVYYGGNYNENGYQYVGIRGNMNFVDLAVFAGCKTAEGTDNLAKRAHNYGAKNSIGWTKEVLAVQHSLWLIRFCQQLSNGYSVASAITHANSFYYLPGSNVKDNVLYSNDRSAINLTISDMDSIIESQGTTNNSVSDPENILDYYCGDTTINNQNNPYEVATIIQKINLNFDISDYKVYIYNNSDEITTIDFVRLIGGFETNTGYTAVINCNKLIKLYDNTKEIKEESIVQIQNLSEQLGIDDQLGSKNEVSLLSPKTDNLNNDSEILNEALQIALENTQASPQKEAAQQRYHYYYDCNNDTASILIYTDYYYDGTDCMGVDFYQYNLNS